MFRKLFFAVFFTTSSLLMAQGVDFSMYVAIGDSLTAGFMNGGLVEWAQRNSFPAIIYRQAMGTDEGFEQPLVGSPGIPPVLQLVDLGPTIVPSSNTFGQPLNLFLPRPYNNLGVPGARVRDTVATTTDNGGMHDLILRQLGYTALQQAASLQPTFVTIWIGNNDVLGAVTSGIVIDGVTLTRKEDFEVDFKTVVGTFAAIGAKMAIATIPSVTAIPFATTIPPYVVDPVTKKPIRIGGELVFYIGPNGERLTSNDFVLLSASSLLKQGIGIPVELGGTGLPLPDEVVLTEDEVAQIRNRTNEFNEIIRSTAAQVGAALVDVAQIFDDIIAHRGLEVGGVTFSTKFLTGGLFSYDGVHPTPFGYAFIANEFIKAINQTFGSNIPQVNLYKFMFESSIPQTAYHPNLEGVVTVHPAAVRQIRKILRVPPIDVLKNIKEQKGNEVDKTDTPKLPDLTDDNGTPLIPAGNNDSPSSGGPVDGSELPVGGDWGIP